MVSLEERVSEHRKRDVLDAIEGAIVRNGDPDIFRTQGRLRLTNSDYSKSRLQRSFDVMFRQQIILPPPGFLRLFNQARGALQFALTNLLDVDLIGSLNGLPQQNTPAGEMTRKNTYIS